MYRFGNRWDFTAYDKKSNDAEKIRWRTKINNRILAITSRDIVASRTHYHNLYYIQYTQHKEATVQRGSTNTGNKEEGMYSGMATSAYCKLFDYIRADIIRHSSVVQMTDTISKFVSFMNDPGIANIKVHTKKYIWRKLQT